MEISLGISIICSTIGCTLLLCVLSRFLYQSRSHWCTLRNVNHSDHALLDDDSTCNCCCFNCTCKMTDFHLPLISATFFIIFVTLDCMFGTIEIILIYINYDYNSSTRSISDDTTIYTLHFINSCIDVGCGIAFCLFYLGRLYDSFQDTIYALNKSTLIILLSIFIITDLLMAFAVFVNVLIVYCVAVSLLVFYLGLITALFSRKLLKLTISIRKSNVMNSINSMNSTPNHDQSKMSQIAKITKFSEQSDDHDNDGYFLNARQISLLQLISKQTLLAFVSGFVTIGWVVIDYFVSVSNIILFEKAESTMGLWLVAGMIGMNTFAVVTSACVWLSFIFAQNDYNILCSKCHSGTLILFASMAMTSIIKNESGLSNNSDSTNIYQQMSQ